MTNRRGGTSRALKHLTMWCMLLSILGLLFLVKYGKVKKNYTELHRRVTELERRLNER